MGCFLIFQGDYPATLSQADQVLDYKSWSEEDKEMFRETYARRTGLISSDYALECAEAKGLERGIEQGLKQV